MLYFHAAEKLAEATRKFATLQSDLAAAVATHVGSDSTRGSVHKRRRSTTLPTSEVIDKKTARKSMHDIKLAFSEFYLSLILLQNYQTLNFTGFRKILKKHDKVV
jgi:SPX domain protein involved in polyphosphate accumulation